MALRSLFPLVDMSRLLTSYDTLISETYLIKAHLLNVNLIDNKYCKAWVNHTNSMPTKSNNYTYLNRHLKTTVCLLSPSPTDCDCNDG